MFSLGNLIEETRKLKEESLKIVEKLPFIKLTDEICRKFEIIMKDKWGNNCICYSSFFQVETSKEHWAVCPHQYLALAAVAYDYAFCLKKYFDFFDEKIRNKPDQEVLIIEFQNLFKKNQKIDYSMADNWLNQNNLEPYIKHIEQYKEDKESLCYFLSAIDSKKFGNEKGVLRGTIDLFGSFILANVPLTSAASGFFGCLVYTLIQQQDFYAEIKQIVKNACEHSSNSSDATNYLILPLVDESSFQGMSKDEVMEKLVNEFDSMYHKYGSTGTRYFGFKFKEILDSYGIENTNITKSSTIKLENGMYLSESSYSGEIGKGKQLFDVIKQDRLSISDISRIETKPIPTSQTNYFTPTQIIYYGVPGCGKSYEVNKEVNSKLDEYGITDKEYHKVRCVFHPEYCSADFVGQIYPYVKPDNGGVEYRFKPGPFAEIVRRAYRNPKKPFFLIIEEINRGNAAAIFGETFQLLDRIRPEDALEELSGNTYDTGWSSYGINNIDVNAYVRQKSTDNPEKIEYEDYIPYGDKIKFINNTAIRLPPNLSIYATMNTSDQNVSAMDNAFQRRFKSKMIRNDLTCESQYNLKIGDTGVCWGSFRDWINGKILLLGMGSSKAEDKCLGGWFIKREKKINEDGSVSNEYADFQKDEFAEKVLKYLWNDVFNRNKSFEIFNSNEVKSLSSLIDVFEKSEGIDSFKKVFILTDEEIGKLKQEKSKNL